MPGSHGDSTLPPGVKLLARALISATLLGALLWSVEWDELNSRIGSIDPWPLSAAFACFVLQFPLSTYKWQRALAAHGLKISFAFLLRVLSIGFFLNNFLPTSIGGDAYRVYRTLPEEGPGSRAISSVVLERLIGVAALVLFGVVGASVVVQGQQPPIVVGFLAGSVAVLIAIVAIAALARTRPSRRIRRRLASSPKLAAITDNLERIRESRHELVQVVAVSLVFQAVAVTATWLLFRAVGATPSIAQCALVGAVSALVAVLPISFNGVGVLEGAFVVSAVQIGLDARQSVAVALLSRVAVIVLSLACGLFYVVEPRTARPSARSRKTENRSRVASTP